MPLRIVLIVESAADKRRLCGLIDRKIAHHAPDDFDSNDISGLRIYTGIEPHTELTLWKDIKSMSEGHAMGRGSLIGHPSEQVADRKYDYPSTRKALILCAQQNPRPDAIILMRDLDKQAGGRRKSIEVARDEFFGKTDMQIILALAHHKREAWVLNGFEPQNKNEKSIADQLRQELGFNPCENAELLDAESRGAKETPNVFYHK